MYEKIRWGIIGTGNIAKKFAEGLTALPDAELLAVGSRAQDTADKFGDQFNIPRRYPTYEALVNDADVDAVYISTLHPFHKDNTILALNAGKAVITEKPFAVNAAEAQAMIDVAKKNNVFLMEAMWTRFLPAIVRVRELLAEGAIGEPRMVSADFGFRAGLNPQHRLFNPEFAGGALLDVGIYVMSFASMVFGTPNRISGFADIGETTSVDEQMALVFGYPGGQLATLTAAVRTNTPHDAVINGTDGRIRVHPSFWYATKLTLTSQGKNTEIELPLTGNGYNYEAAEVGRCLRAGLTESETMPLSETLSIMQTMDTIRAQWGLKYPME